MKPFLASAALALLASCASVQERFAQDRGAVASDVQLRTGANPRPADVDDARELLERPLDMDSAVRVALALSPHIRERFAELGVASAERSQAGRVRNPLFQASAAFFEGGTEIDLGLTQSLVDLITRAARRDAAQASLDAARARTTRELIGAIYDVRRAWVGAYVAERELDLAREATAAEEAADELARALHDAGNLTDPRRTESATNVVRARLELGQAQERRSVAREELAVRLALPAGIAQLELSNDGAVAAIAATALTEPDEATVEARVVDASLELLESRSTVAVAARRAGVAKWNTLLQNSSGGVAARRESGDDALGASLSIPLPLFDDGEAAHAAATHELDAALARHEARVIAVRSAARRKRAQLVQSAQRASTANDELLPLARQFVTQTLRQFNAMQIGVFDVLEARRVEFSAAREALAGLRDAWIARLEFEELMAGGSVLELDQDASERTARRSNRP